jgi:hypothetical protein
MANVRLSTVGAVCAVLTVGLFVAGIALTASSGVQVLIPETGAEGREWIADVDGAGDIFFVGAWLIIFGGFLGLVALIGFYDALRDAGPVLLLAPILGAVGLTLVTVSHLVPIALAYDFVPGYVSAGDAGKETLDVTADTFASLALITNYAGNVLNWGVVVPLYAWAILRTGAVPRWIAWLGFVTAFFAGWLGLFAPASSVIEGLTTIGFFGFFAFLLSLGIALLRRRQGRAAPAVPVPAR